MQKDLQNLKNEALAQIIHAKDSEELENIRVSYLGRSGKLSKLIKDISVLQSDEKKQVGRLINDTKNTLINLISERKNALKESAREWFDPTIPGEKIDTGHLHILTQAIEEISSIFENIGFVRVRYPEIEWDWFAFTALNFPKDHPARDEWETYFIDTPKHPKYGEMLLSPHTSSGQIREMNRVKKPPIRMLNIAKNYRRQSDASHYPMFHQFEGLVIDKGISIVHLKGTLDHFVKQFFGAQIKTRLRPYDFKFTEPSFEVDITCMLCMGKGCRVCKEGWLEQLGAGMIHPNVLKAGGIDPKEYSGFAFGWGVERAL